jgi:uncharacterized membrane protein
MSAQRSGRGSSHLRRRGWWAAVGESIESRLWPVPVAAVIVAVVLGIALPRIDVAIDGSLPAAVDSAVFNGGADTARSVLSSIAGSLITATSLTFSLTVIALQLASSQASPRVLRLFARDRQVHWTLAAFLGTFAYSITVLRSVRAEAEGVPEFVPRISVTLAFVLTLLSVVMLVFFLAHLAAQLRVETMLKEIHADTDHTIERVGERNASALAFSRPVEVPETRNTVLSASSGFVTGHDHDVLIEVAAGNAIVVQETTRVGENIVAGTPLAFWWPAGPTTRDTDAAAVIEAVRAAYTIGYERTATEDVDYGVQQIIDIALRALSPGVNDPTTAVHALGHLSALTARILTMPKLPEALSGSDGRLRVITALATKGRSVDAALGPLRHYGAEHPAVVRRFVQVDAELSYLCADPEVDAALLDQLDALTQQLRTSNSDPAVQSQLLAVAASARSDISKSNNHPATHG